VVAVSFCNFEGLKGGAHHVGVPLASKKISQKNKGAMKRTSRTIIFAVLVNSQT
jgi:hypothetical protein